MSLAYTSPGVPTGFVNDYAGLLNAQEKKTLERSLALFTASTTHQIAVVTVPTTGDDPIEDYAASLFKEWGIGYKDKDNGVLLLIAANDHAMRIEVGYGLEGIITDAKASKIIQSTLRPAFQKKDFYGGITTATNQLMSLIQNAADAPRHQENSNPHAYIYGLLIFAIVLLGLFLGLGALVARGKRYLAQRKKTPSTTDGVSKDSAHEEKESAVFSHARADSDDSDDDDDNFSGFGGGSSGGGGASGSW